MKVLDVNTTGRPATAPRPLRLVNLLNDLDELVHLLHGELEHGSALNAYLLAAGICQVTEDYLHYDRGVLGRAAAHLQAGGTLPARSAATVVRAVDASRRGVRRVWGGDQPVEAWLAHVTELVGALAPRALTSREAAAAADAAPAAAKRLFAHHLELPARLRGSILRLPSCFRSFDQHPEDMRRLAIRYAADFEVRSTATAVVGVRTSGSYLAPLVAAALKSLGFDDVAWLTMRPGAPLGKAQRRALRHVRQAGGRVLVVDDPPTTGSSMRRTASELARHGVRQDAIVLLVPLLRGAVEPPEAIRRQTCVVLPWTEWSINDRLAPGSVRDALSGIFGRRGRVVAVERAELDAGAPRGHAAARYRVTLAVADGATEVIEVHASGAGLGYLGEHSLAVARNLGRFMPRVYGLVDGVLFREWLSDERRLERVVGVDDPRVTAAVTDYVASRQAALRVPEDVALRLRGRLPAWEAVSNMISRAFGRGWAWARLPLVDPIVAECLRVDAPSVVDGSMAPANWFRGDSWPRTIRKTDADRRAFANLDLATYDAAFDVAAFAADTEMLGSGQSASLRRGYGDATGTTVSAERWFLLQALHLWDRLRLGDGDDSTLRRAMSRASQRYFAEVFLDDLPVSADGPLVAIDVDGVLEGDAIGFSSLTRASAVALRALRGHGFRPVLMTGRSLPEVEDRCATLGLAGGVAEYGSVAYDHAGRAARMLLSDAECGDIARARDVLSRLAGLSIDDAYRHSVRLFRVGADGRRRAPSLDPTSAALASAGLEGPIDVIVGDSQVDVVAGAVSKGVGLQSLAAMLGAREIALAVGDGPRDVSAFRMAVRSVAPAHAPAAVRNAASSVARHRYQAGFADAVESLIGHRPGACPVCRVPTMAHERARLLAVLSAQERGGIAGMMAAAVDAVRWAR